MTSSPFLATGDEKRLAVAVCCVVRVFRCAPQSRKIPKRASSVSIEPVEIACPEGNGLTLRLSIAYLLVSIPFRQTTNPSEEERFVSLYKKDGVEWCFLLLLFVSFCFGLTMFGSISIGVF